MADLPIGNEGSMTGTTAVTLLAGPSAGATQRVVPPKGAGVYNKDTVNHDITFQKNKGAAITEIHKVTGVVPGGSVFLDKVVTLDATNESLEGKLNAAATTTQPTFDVSAIETT